MQNSPTSHLEEGRPLEPISPHQELLKSLENATHKLEDLLVYSNDKLAGISKPLGPEKPCESDPPKDLVPVLAKFDELICTTHHRINELRSIIDRVNY